VLALILIGASLRLYYYQQQSMELRGGQQQQKMVVMMEVDSSKWAAQYPLLGLPLI
jgi:hypothetical protein